MSNFQTILVTIFVTAAVVAVLIFSGVINVGGKDKSVITGKVTIWGTFNKKDLYELFDSISGESNGDLSINYVQKSKTTYQADLIEAIARDQAPDLFIISPDMIIENDPFIYKVPYENFSEKSFRDAYIDGADIYLGTDGIVGFPIVVDPMVMYYNKNMFSNEGIASTPSYWDELFNLNSRLTKKKEDGTILESMIALGEFNNIKNAKDILMTLMLQSGNPIISKTEKGYTANIKDNPLSLKESPLESSYNFYSEFSSPSTSAYSWNSTLPNSFDLFNSDKLAIYIGHASELFKIQSTNPNLSFDVRQIPQARGVKSKRTYADIYAIAVNKKSKNISASFSLANKISSGTYADSFAKSVSLPPASRALLNIKPKESYLDVFFNSSIISRSWLDPNDIGSDKVFSELLNNVSSNKMNISEASDKANGQLIKLINN